MTITYIQAINNGDSPYAHIAVKFTRDHYIIEANTMYMCVCGSFRLDTTLEIYIATFELSRHKM